LDRTRICPGTIRAIRFDFDGEKRGSVALDQIGFTL